MRLSQRLGVEVLVKRDDLTGPGMGGNKIRQLEFYLGDALAKGADTVLITGAVQSNTRVPRQPRRPARARCRRAARRTRHGHGPDLLRIGQRAAR